MSKKQLIICIGIGIAVVFVYWLFFTGPKKKSEADEQAAVVKEILDSQENKQKQALRETMQKEDAERVEQQAIIKKLDDEIKKGIRLEENYYNRALANEKLQRYNAAIDDYSKALEVNPNRANTYFNRALVYERRGEYEQALKDYTKALELKPEDYRLYNTRALAYVEQGQMQNALDDYNKSLELNNQYAEAYFNRGTLFERNKDYKQAYDDYSKAIELHSNPPKDVDARQAQSKLGEAYYRRAIVYYINGDFEPALSDVNKAISIDERDIKAYQLRSNIYDKTGNVAAAAADEATAQTLSLESLLPGGQQN